MKEAVKREDTATVGARLPQEEVAADWHPELVESLYRLLYLRNMGSAELSSGLAKLQHKYGAQVYSELIFLLSHLRFDGDEAKGHWERVVAHRETMRRRMRKPVDLRVALVSYFVEVNRQLRNPKIIELKVFEETRAFAYRDELTGLCNFRYFREHLAREMQRSERYSTPLSLVMIDIDDFKIYNDRFGHEAANRALVTIARLLSGSLRKIDVAARYGGEEFALILPSTSKTAAGQVAERTRKKIEGHPFIRGPQYGRNLTVSMGVATFPADASQPTELVRRADRSMYAAKTNGKNQVHLFGESHRSYRRVDATLTGRFTMMSDHHYPLTTINISAGGFLAITNQNLPTGSLVKAEIALPGEERGIIVSGQVIRVIAKAGGEYQTAVRIVDMETRDQMRLARYLRELNPAA